MVRASTGGSDAVLLARLQAGDERALADAYTDYGGYVYGLVRRVTGSNQAAEDLTQEVFAHLWERPFDVDPSRGTIRTFLGVVAHRRAVDWVRSETRRQARDDRAIRLADPPIDVSDAATDRVSAARVRAALDQLPESQRRAVMLAYFEGCSYREVARRLDIPVGTAKSRLRLALARLAQVLDAERLSAWSP
jgi:RNA polymerase sigma-70 factor (ECF subfamily)